MGNEKHEAHFVLDGGLVATLSLATCTLLVAGACARKQTRRELNKQLLLRQGSEHREGGTQDGREEDEEPNLVISEKLAVFIVFQATAGLLLFYFLLSKIFFTVILVLYTLISIQAIQQQSSLLLECFFVKDESKKGWLQRNVRLPVFGDCKVYQLASFALALTLSVTWSCIRLQSKWAWVLQDISGICIILTILMLLKLPNIKIACILLPLIMMYDVFFVYIQPLIFHNESVMKKVATGGDTHEILPMALIVPNFSNPDSYSMLGYGDIVLPGLLLVYAASFDEINRLTWFRSYFFLEVSSYVLGLVLTLGALALDIGGQGGQPALLYLVPCTLGTILVTSGVRGDLKNMFYSSLPTVVGKDVWPSGGNDDERLEQSGEDQSLLLAAHGED